MLIAQEKTLPENMDYMLYAEKVHNDFSAESCLNVACEILPVIRNAIKNYGGNTLSEYLNQIIPEAGTSYQSMTDLLEVVNTYTKPLLGEKIAKQVANDIEACPVVLTANHHGVAYFAQDFQGCIIFSSTEALARIP